MMIPRHTLRLVVAAAVHACMPACPTPAAAADRTGVTVAIIQYQVRDADKVGADADRLAKFVRAAAGRGAKIVVAPETCFYRYGPWERNGVTLADLASEYPALTDRFAALAKELGVCLVIGLREPLDDKHVYNTAVLLGPDGKVLGKHRKTVPSSSEKAWTRAGKTARAFRTPHGTVGMLICKDAKTHWWKTYNDDRLDLYVLIAGDDDGRSFGSFSRTAAEAGCHAVLANQVTKGGKGKGNSAYAYPSGQVVFLGGGEKVFYATLPLGAPAAAGQASAKAGPGRDLGDLGRFAKWAKVEIALAGPASTAAGRPNPFDILVDATFTSPAGKKTVVPGFHDGDGKGGPDGDVWKVRFAADQTGKWTFASKSAEGLLDGRRGSFTVTDTPADAPGFYRLGRLEYVGTPADGVRYLKFRDGPYWLKAGCDDPENFLGRFKNYDTPAKRREAVDYLAAKGVNSLYVMTHNLGGDHRDVWPWLGETEAEARRNGAKGNVRFDVARLRRWGELFEHMQRRGVVPYLVLEDDSCWTGHDYARYYREIVARFGHLPALLFNFCEEANERHKLPEALAWMKRLAEIDPYGHPRGIHNVNRPTAAYVDAPQVHFTAIQTRPAGGATKHNKLAIDWINLCRQRKRRVLMVNFDEPRPEGDRRGWWSAYMGGGVWEVHTTQPYDVPMSHWAKTWTQLGGARAFMETLPFWTMDPHNEAVVAGKAFCLARPGAAYALYLPEGGTVTVALAGGKTYQAAWWDPANGRDGKFRPAGTVKAGRQSFTAPAKGDWALRILATK